MGARRHDFYPFPFCVEHGPTFVFNKVFHSPLRIPGFNGRGANTKGPSVCNSTQQQHNNTTVQHRAKNT